MTTRFATLMSQLALALTMMFALAACGGGGGGGGGGFLGEGGDDGTDTYYIEAQLVDEDGNTVSLIDAGAAATVRVVVRKNGRNGPPIADVIVDIDTGSGGLLSPSTASKLTDSEGRITLRVEAGSTKGADTIVASAQDENGVTVNDSINFQVGNENLRLGRFIDGVFFDAEIDITPEGQIPSDGAAILSVSIVDENDQLVGSAESVRFTSPCLNSGEATLEEGNPVGTETGTVSVTYLPSGCTGSDAITAEIVGNGAQAVGQVSTAAPGGSTIGFVSANPELIVLRGTSGGPNRVESSTITFRTTDSKNNPVKGIEVRFELSTDVGGITINPTSAVSDANGQVSTVVTSGDVATVVRVIATADAADGSGEISALSNLLTITTGLPDQNSIDVGVVGDSVVETAMSQIGLTRQVSVRMADKFNNPVPDGTAAVFTTEYGAIESRCTTTDGECSVTWTSQNPTMPTLESNQPLVKRIDDSDYSCPAHNGRSGPCPADMGSIRGGRSTVLVHAIGEESFIDRNGNGVFDQEEADEGLFVNLTEVFIDHNEDGDGPNNANPNLYDPQAQRCQNDASSLDCRSGSEETFVDYNSNGVFDANGDDPNNGYPDEGVTAMFNGLLCPPEGDGVWCTRELIHVRASTTIILGGGPPYFIALYRDRTPVNSTTYNNTYEVHVSDIFNNRPPAGTSVNITAAGACGVTTLTDPTIPNTNDAGAFTVRFTQTGEENAETDRTDNEITISYGGAELTVPCEPKPAPPPTEPPDPDNPDDGLVIGPG